MIAKHKLQARLINHIVLRASSLWLCGRRGFADGGGERLLGGACTPDATNFQPSPQIELGGSLTSGSLTWQQRCNHNSNTIDPMTALQAQHQPKSLCYSKKSIASLVIEFDPPDHPASPTPAQSYRRRSLKLTR
jgi:hypothetical protein